MSLLVLIAISAVIGLSVLSAIPAPDSWRPDAPGEILMSKESFIEQYRRETRFLKDEEQPDGTYRWLFADNTHYKMTESFEKRAAKKYEIYVYNKNGEAARTLRIFRNISGRTHRLFDTYYTRYDILCYYLSVALGGLFIVTEGVIAWCIFMFSVVPMWGGLIVRELAPFIFQN